jgi:hypothetical protein
MKKLFFISLLLSFIFLAEGKSVLAENAYFTSCLTPVGTITANYPTGSHGIIGQGSQNGADTVYSLANDNAMQCFCGSNGQGIQTNWLNASNLSSDQIKVYQNKGYIYVPDGTPWGLSNNPYLAQNITYSCGSSVSIVQSSHGDGLSDGRSDGLSDGKSSIVQATTGTPSSFGLASTGNIVFVLSILIAGIVLFLAGLFLKRKNY